jgi:H+/Cl- antiporter ClcA
MLAITFLPALGFVIIGILLGFYGAYRLFTWAMSEDKKRVPHVVGKLKLDYFEEQLS